MSEVSSKACTPRLRLPSTRGRTSTYEQLTLQLLVGHSGCGLAPIYYNDEPINTPTYSSLATMLESIILNLKIN